MKKICSLIAACFLLFSVAPAMAQVVDIAGPWILDFPQGRGMVVLQNTGGQPPNYSGQVTLPYPNSSGSYIFNVKMTSVPSYVVPGNNITFQPSSAPGVQFFMMNVSSGSNGIAWIIPSAGADNHLLKFYNLKAPAHR